MKIDKLVNYCDKDIKKYAFSEVCADCERILVRIVAKGENLVWEL